MVYSLEYSAHIKNSGVTTGYDVTRAEDNDIGGGSPPVVGRTIFCSEVRDREMGGLIMCS
jgi:hypothetical protein